MALRLFALSLTAFVSVASSTLQRPRDPTHHAERNSTVSPALFAELEELSRIVDISYCVGLTGTGIQKPFSCLSRCREFEGFELLTAWNTGPLLSDSCGYIALSHEPSPRRILLAFRGTYSIANTLADLSTVPQEYIPYPGNDTGDATDAVEAPPKCENCTVHMGFYSSWRNTRNEILETVRDAVAAHPGYALTLVGHSLGGAVAALAGLDFIARGWDPVVTTFGEPRIGNEALVQYLDTVFNLTDGIPGDGTAMKFRRVTHVDDPVPLLPLEEWGYLMHGGEIHINRSAVPPENGDVSHCRGRDDPRCIAGGSVEHPEAALDWDVQEPVRDGTSLPPALIPEQSEQRLLTELRKRWGIEDVIPPRYRLWQLFFAHRDYFWRLGLCVPPTSWWRDRVDDD